MKKKKNAKGRALALVREKRKKNVSRRGVSLARGKKKNVCQSLEMEGCSIFCNS